MSTNDLERLAQLATSPCDGGVTSNACRACCAARNLHKHAKRVLALEACVRAADALRRAPEIETDDFIPAYDSARRELDAA